MTVKLIHMYGNMLANDELDVNSFNSRDDMIRQGYECIRYPIINNIKLQRLILNIHSPWFERESGLKDIFFTILGKVVTVYCNHILYSIDPEDVNNCYYGRGVLCRTLLDYIKPNMLEYRYNLDYSMLRELRRLSDYVDETIVEPMAFLICNHISSNLSVSITEYLRVEILDNKVTVDLVI